MTYVENNKVNYCKSSNRGIKAVTLAVNEENRRQAISACHHNVAETIEL